MDKNTTFLGWIAGGVGIILLYSAYRNEGPVSVVRKALSGGGSTTIINDRSGTNLMNLTPLVPDAGPYTLTGSVAQRATAVGGTTDSKQWVSVGSQPTYKLAPNAATSFAAVEAQFGSKIPLNGAGRSYAEQVIGYATNPERFATPGNSLHEYGLAVDLAYLQQKQLDNPALIAAFTSHGWFRRGKKGAWWGTMGGQDIPEPWHWSFAVPG